MPHRVFDADYWAANLRNPVRFSQAVAAAGAAHTTFIEVSPHPLLTHAISDTLGRPPITTASALCSATPTTPSPSTPTSTPPTPPAHRSTARTLPNRTRRCPPRPGTTPATGSPPRTGHPPLGTHPLLGIGVTDPTNGIRVWESTLGPGVLWLGDHRVDEACVLPGAAYAELALAAVTDAFGADGDEPWMIRELCLDQLMHVTDGTVVVTTLSGDESKPRVEIRSRSGTIRMDHACQRDAGARRAVPARAAAFDDAAAAELDPDELYRRLRSAGQQHGPAFQGIVGLSVSDTGVAHAEVRLPSPAKTGLAAVPAAPGHGGHRAAGARCAPRRPPTWLPGRPTSPPWYCRSGWPASASTAM